MKKIVRSSFLWVHRWLGLVSGLVVFVVSITGCFYVFEEELRFTFYSHYLTVPEQNTFKVPVSQLYEQVQRAYPNETITQIRLRNDPANSAIIAITKSERLISVNPYTGQPFAIRDHNDDLLALSEEIHTNLLLGEFGKQVVKWNVLIFFIILLSGLWVWWPKQWRFLRAAVTVKWGASFKRVNYDLHSVAGFYALLVLLAIAWSGLYWTFEPAKQLTYWLTGETMKKKEKLEVQPLPTSIGTSALLDLATQQADALGPFRLAFYQFPKDEKAPFRLVLRYPYTWVRSQNVLQLDPYSGKLLKSELAKDYTAADKIRMSNYDVHTGRMFGLTSKILWCLASLFSASLPVTGFLVWWGKRRKNRKKARAAHRNAHQLATPKQPRVTI